MNALLWLLIFVPKCEYKVRVEVIGQTPAWVIHQSTPGICLFRGYQIVSRNFVIPLARPTLAIPKGLQ